VGLDALDRIGAVIRHSLADASSEDLSQQDQDNARKDVEALRIAQQRLLDVKNQYLVFLDVADHDAVIDSHIQRDRFQHLSDAIQSQQTRHIVLPVAAPIEATPSRPVALRPEYASNTSSNGDIIVGAGSTVVIGAGPGSIVAGANSMVVVGGQGGIIAGPGATVVIH
jgi:hypothetical protein